MVYIKKYGVIIAAVIVVIISFIVNGRNQTEPPMTLTVPETLDITDNAFIYVDVKGAVKQPGVYKLSDDARLFQAIELAGGFLVKANTLSVNLSQLLVDQMVIYVPEIGESTSQVIDTDQQSMVVNINTADQTTLESLPGVGPATAQNIIAYRTEVGPFETIEDIMNVSGIGEETFANLSAYIMV